MFPNLSDWGEFSDRRSHPRSREGGRCPSRQHGMPYERNGPITPFSPCSKKGSLIGPKCHVLVLSNAVGLRNCVGVSQLSKGSRGFMLLGRETVGEEGPKCDRGKAGVEIPDWPHPSPRPRSVRGRNRYSSATRPHRRYTDPNGQGILRRIWPARYLEYPLG